MVADASRLHGSFMDTVEKYWQPLSVRELLWDDDDPRLPTEDQYGAKLLANLLRQLRERKSTITQ